MCDSEAISQQISLFRSLIQTRRFDDATLRILESVLISRDVKSLLDVRRSLMDFMRHESLCVLREFKEKSVDHKLLILDFFVRTFAFTGDVETCLALRYEALVLRELMSVRDHRLHVPYEEWFTFAVHAFENRFYAIARKACEKALACFQTNDMLNRKEADASSEDMEAIRKVKQLKNIAVIRVDSQSVPIPHSYKKFGEKSVQAQAVEYMKRKIDEDDQVSMLVVKEKRHPASVMFRNGIKKRNTQKLQELQKL